MIPFDLIAAGFAFISELMPFLPGHYNGIFHGVLVALGFCATTVQHLTPNLRTRTLETPTNSEEDILDIKETN